MKLLLMLPYVILLVMFVRARRRTTHGDFELFEGKSWTEYSFQIGLDSRKGQSQMAAGKVWKHHRCEKASGALMCTCIGQHIWYDELGEVAHNELGGVTQKAITSGGYRGKRYRGK